MVDINNFSYILIKRSVMTAPCPNIVARESSFTPETIGRSWYCQYWRIVNTDAEIVKQEPVETKKMWYYLIFSRRNQFSCNGHAKSDATPKCQVNRKS